MMDTFPEVGLLRQRIYARGYRPIPIPKGLKFPPYDGWQTTARLDPPPCVVSSFTCDSNTGILCDTLRVMDIDITDVEHNATVVDYLFNTFGPTVVRYRLNSPKVALVYRAMFGCPTKRRVGNSLTGDAVEVLGVGNQFLAFGEHPTGAALLWLDDESPANTSLADLPAVSEDQISGFLSFVEGVLGVAPSALDRDDGRPLPAASGTATWFMSDLEDVLDHIPNMARDWAFWFEICSASYAASGGSPEGYEAFRAWSARCRSHSDAFCKNKWRSLGKYSLQHTPGTLVYHARQTYPDWRPPSRALSEIPKLFFSNGSNG
jgi:hypothetical protein